MAILKGHGLINNSRFDFTGSFGHSVLMGLEVDYVLISIDSIDSFDGQEKPFN